MHLYSDLPLNYLSLLFYATNVTFYDTVLQYKGSTLIFMRKHFNVLPLYICVKSLCYLP
ncbi:hypothetical protein KUCAC02_019159 [Chaenocephalus aceratus]|uniref:Uncharacterized protein n=1 Tax=Chaenocephalus aceratus TaxID=36190 RepID=A0ACB9WC04_CHAAC|nr:hypothetical protein KUCAC02_019159 [Chaenocephalus aceratus]